MTNSARPLTTRNDKEKVFLIAGARTPFGRFGGALQKISPVDLAVEAGKVALTNSGISPDQIDQVILGNVCPSTTDCLYGGRHLALKLGCPISTPGYVVNRLCGSGIQVLLDGMRLIRSGEAQTIICAGTENMSLIPHLTYGARFGQKYGSLKSVDMLLDSLTDQYSQMPMGVTAENLAKKYDISREECESYAVSSHQKVAKAYQEGHLQGEICSVEVRGKNIVKDEHFRESINSEELSKLNPSFEKAGTVTPATASGIVDGACTIVIASESFVKENSITPMAELVDGVVVGVDPSIMGIGPVPAISQLLSRHDLSIEDIDLFEVNEAFAPQVLACQKELGIPENKLNIWGGAIALGHPLAATGTRISLTLARQLKTVGKKTGIASACIGGGQGISLLIRSCDL